MGTGETPTVEQAAAAASISRATAYRYFPNQHALLVAAFPALTEDSLLGADPPRRRRPSASRSSSTRSRASASSTSRRCGRCCAPRSSPARARRDDQPFRRGRRIVWVGEALAPLAGGHGRGRARAAGRRDRRVGGHRLARLADRHRRPDARARRSRRCAGRRARCCARRPPRPADSYTLSVAPGCSPWEGRTMTGRVGRVCVVAVGSPCRARACGAPASAACRCAVDRRRGSRPRSRRRGVSPCEPASSRPRRPCRSGRRASLRRRVHAYSAPSFEPKYTKSSSAS